MAGVRTLRERAAEELAKFVAMEASSGILLVVAAVLAMLAANSPLAADYETAFHHAGAIGGVALPSLAHAINDGLMALFFLLVGLELKRELVDGQFADRRQILLPGLCALAGMVVPMGIYAWANAGDAVAMRGVAIPAATDIAFALGILALLGSRVPVALKLLLTAIAVADDLGAIVIIAVYYTQSLSWPALAVAAAAVVALVVANRRGVRRVGVYLALGAVLWAAMLKSGVHATLAGVILGMAIPVRVPGDDGPGPLESIEDRLHPWVAYAILPLFAFANAGVPLAGFGLDALTGPVPAGIALGLFVGKQIGIFGMAAALVALGVVRRPEGVGWGALYGMTILCGIGFTMSLFVGALSFDASHVDLLISHRIGILSGSLVSAVCGFALLWLVLPRKAA